MMVKSAINNVVVPMMEDEEHKLAPIINMC